MPIRRSTLVAVLLTGAACGPTVRVSTPAPVAAVDGGGVPSHARDHVAVLLADGDGPRCVPFVVAGGVWVATAGQTCDKTTLSLRVTAQGRLDSVMTQIEHAKVANAMGAEGAVTSLCTPAGPLQLGAYGSIGACEWARAAGVAATAADSCLRAGVTALQANDARLGAVDDAALVHAMRANGHLYSMTAGRRQARRCVAWTFEPEDTDGARGLLTLRDASGTKSRSYRYDAACKSFGLSGFSVSAAQMSATSDVCSVVGRLERANGDAIDVGAHRLFLTESACSSALTTRPSPGDAAPYVADPDGC